MATLLIGVIVGVLAWLASGWLRPQNQTKSFGCGLVGAGLLLAAVAVFQNGWQVLIDPDVGSYLDQKLVFGASLAVTMGLLVFLSALRKYNGTAL